MKIFSNKKLNRKSYHKFFYQRFLPAHALGLVFLAGLFWMKKSGDLETYSWGILIWVVYQGIIATMILNRMGQRCRDMLDNYSSLRSFFKDFVFIVFTPFMMVWEMFILAHNEKMELKEYRKKLSKGFILLPLQLILTISNFQPENPSQFITSQIGVSTGHITTVGLEAFNLFEIRENYPTDAKPKLVEYLNNNDLTSSGIVLSTAIVAADNFKKKSNAEKEIKDSKGKKQLSIVTAHNFLDDILVVLKKENSIRTAITISCGLQLLNPGSSVELGLLEFSEARIMIEGKNKILERLNELHTEIGKKIEDDEALKKNFSDKHQKLSRGLASIK